MHRGLPTLLALVLCAIGLTWCAWHYASGGPAPASATTATASAVTSRPIPPGGWGPLRVMTANVRIDSPEDGDNGWVHRRELLVKTLLKYEPEILACQEVSPAQGAYLRTQLAAWYDYYPRGGIGSTDSAGGATRGATRSAASQILGAFGETLASLNTIYFRSDRFDIVDGEAGLVIPEEPQATATENTYFSLAVLRERRAAPATGAPPGENPGTFIIVDVHFRMNDAFALKCADRIEQKLAAWEAKYPRSGLLLLGDINRDRLSRLYTELTEPRAANAPGGPWAGMQDLFDYHQTPAGGVGGTGANDGGNYHGFKGVTNRAWPTDLIFLGGGGGGLKVANAAQVVRDKDADGRYPSDHFFTMGTVTW